MPSTAALAVARRSVPVSAFPSRGRAGASARRPSAEVLEPRCLLAAGSVIHATGQSIKAVEKTLVTAQVATFTSNSATARTTDFLATIHWGDGTANAGTVAQGSGPGRFLVTGKHTYGDGLDTHLVTTDIAAKVGGAHAEAQSQAAISGASFHVAPVAINAVAGVANQNLLLGTFQILDKNIKFSDLTASVVYTDGPGRISATIVSLSSVQNGFAIVGSHTFASATRAGGGVSQITVALATKPGVGFVLQDPTIVAPPPPPPQNTWTIMVYMEADNVLAPFATVNLIQLQNAAAALPGTVHFSVLLHQETASGPILTGNNKQQWTGTGEAIIQASTSTSQIATTFDTSLGEQNTGDPNTLSSFIQWTHIHAPAQHYALIMWGLGTGVTGLEYHDTQLNGPDHLSIPALASALQTATTQNSLKIDVLAFDASLMQTLEVGTALTPLVGVFVGAEGSPAGTGYPYRTAFSSLATNPGQVSAKTLATGIVQSYAHSYTFSPYLTQSAADSTKYVALEAALHSFTTLAVNLLPSQAPALHTARGPAALDDSLPAPPLVDLGLFMQAIVGNTTISAAVRSAAQGVLDALKQAVIANAASPQQATTGLSIYMPSSGSADPAYLAAYTSFFAATGWDVFLKRFF